MWDIIQSIKPLCVLDNWGYVKQYITLPPRVEHFWSWSQHLGPQVFKILFQFFIMAVNSENNASYVVNS